VIPKKDTLKTNIDEETLSFARELTSRRELLTEEDQESPSKKKFNIKSLLNDYYSASHPIASEEEMLGQKVSYAEHKLTQPQRINA
jgi:hypothetical protein